MPNMTDRLHIIESLPGMGRTLVEHDDQSKGYPARALVAQDTPRSKTWRRGEAYDQGRTSECVANTGKGMLNTTPHSGRVPYRVRSGYDRHEFYVGAQRADQWPGESPDYEGTSGLGLCKYLAARGLISEYRWCFGLADVLMTLAWHGPVGVGVWWYRSMFTPGARGVLTVGGERAGGHEVELIGVDVAARQVIGVNSWGTGWGDGGRFRLSWDDLEGLLSEEGDAFTIVR